MPRRRADVPPGPAATAAPARVIEENGVYRLDELTVLLRLKRSSLSREVKEGRLRVSKRCGTYFFVGMAVLDWLKAGEIRPTKTGG